MTVTEAEKVAYAQSSLRCIWKDSPFLYLCVINIFTIIVLRIRESWYFVRSYSRGSMAVESIFLIGHGFG